MRLTNRDGLVQHVQAQFERHGILMPVRVVIGVSGGLASMMLAETCLRAGCEVQIAHVNYGLRGAESDEDEAFVMEWCEARHLPFHLKRVQLVDGESGIQAAARQERYAFFETVRATWSSAAAETVYIAAGHQANDQAETVLLNLLRGADPLGLAAMPFWDRARHVVRPLIEIPRSELQAQALAWEVSHREDSSNAKSDYFRNRLRLEGLPLLESFRPGSTEHLARWAARFQPIAAHVREEIEASRNKCWNAETSTLALEPWRNLPLRTEVLHVLAKEFGIGARAVSEIEKLTERGVESGAKFECRTATIIRERQTLRWTSVP